jgi:hypothetical protein
MEEQNPIYENEDLPQNLSLPSFTKTKKLWCAKKPQRANFSLNLILASGLKLQCLQLEFRRTVIEFSHTAQRLDLPQHPCSSLVFF